MKKTFELTDDGKVRITQDVVQTTERFIELSAVEKRIDDLKKQIKSLEDELSDLQNIKNIKKNKKLEVEIKI